MKNVLLVVFACIQRAPYVASESTYSQNILHLHKVVL
jgi:hypothetical protein